MIFGPTRGASSPTTFMISSQEGSSPGKGMRDGRSALLTKASTLGGMVLLGGINFHGTEHLWSQALDNLTSEFSWVEFSELRQRSYSLHFGRTGYLISWSS